jgi:hypothetical protein
MAEQFSYPTSSFGYYRGTPYYQGEGAGQGGIVAGQGVFSAGQGNASATGWSPTILYLFVLLLAEIVIFGIIARHV